MPAQEAQSPYRTETRSSAQSPHVLERSVCHELPTCDRITSSALQHPELYTTQVHPCVQDRPESTMQLSNAVQVETRSIGSSCFVKAQVLPPHPSQKHVVETNKDDQNDYVLDNNQRSCEKSSADPIGSPNPLRARSSSCRDPLGKAAVRNQTFLHDEDSKEGSGISKAAANTVQIGSVRGALEEFGSLSNNALAALLGIEQKQQSKSSLSTVSDDPDFVMEEDGDLLIYQRPENVTVLFPRDEIFSKVIYSQL